MSQTKVNRRGFLAASGLIGGSGCARGLQSERRRTAARRPASRRLRQRPAPPAAVVERRRRASESREGTVHVQLGGLHQPGQHGHVQGRVRGRERSRTTSTTTTKCSSPSSQGGASGYDIAAPTAEYVPGMVEEGFLAKLDLSRIPNLAVHQQDLQGPVVGPDGRVPGPQGLRHDRHPVSQVASSRRSRSRGRSSTSMIKGEASGKTVFVDSMGDVFVFPLKMLGYSLNSVDKAELDEAPQDPARGRAAPVRPRLQQYGFKMKDGDVGPDPRLDRPARPGAQGREDVRRGRLRRSRPRARCSGWTPG